MGNAPSEPQDPMTNAAEPTSMRAPILADGVTLSTSTLQLTADGRVVCSPTNNSQPTTTVALADVAGVETDGSTLTLHHAPRSSSGCGGGGQRRLRSLEIRCDSAEQATQVRDALRCAIAGTTTPPAPPRLLVLVNPRSGPGNGARIWADCRPIVAASGAALTEVVTASADDAKERVASLDLGAYDGVICVSGDGMVHEVLNGLAARADADAALAALAIGTIPAGSGNALATSLLRAASEPLHPRSAAFLVARGGRAALDLWRVTQPSRQGYAFLSLEWAMASDMDLGSDALRWLGPLRFDIYALLRILTSWKYAGTLRYRRAGSDAWEEATGPFLLFWACNMKYMSADAQVAPEAELGDGLIDLTVLRPAGRGAILSAFVGELENGKYVQRPFVDYFKVAAFELEPQPRTARKPGMIAVDGELWALETTKVEVLPSKLTVLGAAAAEAQAV